MDNSDLKTKCNEVLHFIISNIKPKLFEEIIKNNTYFIFYKSKCVMSYKDSYTDPTDLIIPFVKHMHEFLQMAINLMNTDLIIILKINTDKSFDIKFVHIDNIMEKISSELSDLKNILGQLDTFLDKKVIKGQKNQENCKSNPESLNIIKILEDWEKSEEGIEEIKTFKEKYFLETKNQKKIFTNFIWTFLQDTKLPCDKETGTIAAKIFQEHFKDYFTLANK